VSDVKAGGLATGDAATTLALVLVQRRDRAAQLAEEIEWLSAVVMSRPVSPRIAEANSIFSCRPTTPAVPATRAASASARNSAPTARPPT
jgi:hypothetical protein